MDFENLSTVWGPTIVGHSSTDPAAILSELPLLKNVVKSFLSFSSDYWDRLLQVGDAPLLSGSCTPEIDQIERPSLFPSAKKTGPIAKRTRSRQIRQQFFQSPMLK